MGGGPEVVPPAALLPETSRAKPPRSVPFRHVDDVRLRIEADAALSSPLGRMRMESRRPPSEGQAANFVAWLPWEIPDEFVAEWSFWPVTEPGLAMVFFGAQARGGGDLFAPSLPRRSGEYDQYRYGEVDAYHLSYFRRSLPEERRLHTINLRRSYGSHLLGQGADPVPGVADAVGPYRLRLSRRAGRVSFAVDGMPVLDCADRGPGVPPVTGGGYLGFRQMAPLIAEYADLELSAV